MAFQSYHRGKWFSCAPNPCSSRHTCPGFSIGDTKWTNCWGEVFQFYRARGSGRVRVGDVVGVYYPYEAGKWLGCYRGNCVKATCPGTPSNTYGFQSQDKWTVCPGEVFKIYYLVIVHYQPEGGSPMYTVSNITAVTSATLPNLQCDTKYTIRVEARGGLTGRNSLSRIVSLPARGMYMLCNLPHSC